MGSIKTIIYQYHLILKIYNINIIFYKIIRNDKGVNIILI